MGEATNGLEAVELAQAQRSELVFLDVQMPRLDGFEVLELLDRRIGAIFTTAYDQYALQVALEGAQHLEDRRGPVRWHAAVGRERALPSARART